MKSINTFKNIMNMRNKRNSRYGMGRKMEKKNDMTSS